MPGSGAASPFPTFRDASDATLEYLQRNYPMGLWMVTRTVGDDWIVLRAQDRSYDVAEGDLFRWSDSFCSRMVRGKGPHIAPDSATVPAYAVAPIGQQIPIASYIGFPLESDGELFGTLCAIDTTTKPDDLTEADETIGLLARLLSTILQADMRANQLSDLAQSLSVDAHRDALTEVLNRRGWDRLSDRAESNRTSYGQTHCVVIVDLNGLKVVNDTQGHSAGDQLLRDAARALSAAARHRDIVARLGGDEFGVLLEEPDSLTPGSFMRTLRQALAAKGVSAAIGFGLSGASVPVAQAQAEADALMYVDKQTR